MKGIKVELAERLDILRQNGMLLEAERLEQRISLDLEMMDAAGFCPGIENYSRYLTGRNPGEPPPTLFEYIPENALVILDESHVTVPQLGGMFRLRGCPLVTKLAAVIIVMSALASLGDCSIEVIRVVVILGFAEVFRGG